MNSLESLLETQGFLLADGATGTNYFTLGLEVGHPPEMWNIENPEAVGGLHRRFLAAGADIILTNSFGGTAQRLQLHGAEARVAELNFAAAQLARTAADEHKAETGKTVLVAGSMGPTGELFAPLGALDHAGATEAFAAQAQALADGGVDLLWIETISALEEVAAAIEAGQKTGLAIAATMTFDTAGKSMMGVTPEDYASRTAQMGAVALGANCGVGPAELMHSVLLMKPHTTRPIIAKGNCGIPEYREGQIHYHGTPELMAQYAVLARDAGVAIIGGCCGTTPEHLAAMRLALDTVPRGASVGMAEVEATLGKAWAGLGGAASQAPDKKNPNRANRRRRR